MNEMLTNKDALNDTVCAVVVTYNRKNLLLECLEALLKQTKPVDAIYIIDNFSSDGTPEMLKENGYITELPPDGLRKPWEREFEVKNFTDRKPVNIYYVRMNENTGGAGGFHEGVKRGYEKGYDWLWLMDDDGLPALDCLNRLLNVGRQGFDYIAPNLLDEKETSHFEKSFKFSRTDIINSYGGPFNGVLLSLRLIYFMGFPIKSFFIWGDEIEYCNRIIEAGFPVVTVKHAIHRHKRTNINYKTCTRGYYFIRNKVYIYRLFQGVYRSKKVYLMGRMYEITRFMIGCILALNFTQVWDSLKGFMHGWINDLHEAQEEALWWGVKNSIFAKRKNL